MKKYKLLIAVVFMIAIITACGKTENPTEENPPVTVTFQAVVLESTGTSILAAASGTSMEVRKIQ